MQVTEWIKQNLTKDKIIAYLGDNGAKEIAVYDEHIRCTCPIHKGNNSTAFAYDLELHLWKCFTGDCGGGDIFDLVKKLSGFEMEFRDLIKMTAGIFGIDIDGMDLNVKRQSAEQDLRKWLQYMSAKKNTKNKPYDINNIGELADIRELRNFNKATIDFFGIKRSTLYNRIAVPLCDADGTLVGITMRRCDEAEKIKWLHRPKNINTGLILYNIENVNESFCYVVEGVFDAINMHQIGLPAVACLGSHLTEHQESMLLRKFMGVVLAYDNDKAGKTATQKAIEKLKSKCNLYVLDLGDYKDVGEIPDKEAFKANTKLLKWYEWKG